MTDTSALGALSRRQLLAIGGAAAAVAGLSACGGGKSAQEAAGGSQPSATFTGGYNGPAVTLSYWNGFTGGDGPFMKQMVADFMKENPKIKVSANTVEWAQYYQRMPAAVTAGKGPDVGVMHLDQLATNAARKAIVPVDDLAKAIGLTQEDFTPEVWQAGIYHDARYGIPLDVHSLGMYYNTDQMKKAGVSSAPHRRGVLHRRARQAEGVGAGPPVLDAEPLAGAPDVPVAAVAERRRAVRRRREQGDVRLAGGGRRADLDGRGGREVRPLQRRPGLPVRRLQERQDVGHLGRHLADQRPQGCQGPLRPVADPDHRPDQGGLGELPQLLHHPAGLAGREQAPGGQGLHRLDEQEVGRVGRRRDGARAQVRARVGRRSARPPRRRSSRRSRR